MWRFYRWYDRQKEPWRQLLLFALIAVGSIPVAISLRNIYFTLLYFAFLIFTRMYYVAVVIWRPLKKKKQSHISLFGIHGLIVVLFMVVGILAMAFGPLTGQSGWLRF